MICSQYFSSSLHSTQNCSRASRYPPCYRFFSTFSIDSFIWVGKQYQHLEDVGDEPSGDELGVLGDDGGYFVAVLLVAADEVGEGIVQPSLEQKEKVLDFALDEFGVDFVEALEFLEGLVVVEVGDLVEQLVLLAEGQHVLTRAGGT